MNVVLALRVAHLTNFLIAEAGVIVVIDHSNRLHERITDSRADKLESAFSEVLAQRLGKRRLSGHGGPALPIDRLAFNKTPEVFIEAAKLFLNGDKGLRIFDRRRDLQTVTNDSGIEQELLSLVLAVAGDLLRIELVKRSAIALALIQNRFPAKTGLSAFKDQKLEKFPVVVQGHAPFMVVIGN